MFNLAVPACFKNIGNNSPVNLMDFIEAIENELGKKAKKEFLPMQPGDVEATWADVTALADTINFKPCTSIDTGIGEFVKWYLQYSAV